jgi:hypothetical protein
MSPAHHSKEQTEWSKERNAAWQASRARLGLEPNPETSFVDDPVKAEQMSRIKGVTSVHIRPGGSIHSCVRTHHHPTVTRTDRQAQDLLGDDAPGDRVHRERFLVL